MSEFGILPEDLELPPNAFVRGYRKTVTWQGSPVVGFTQGPHRNYLFPVYTPRGYLVTTESPADHPHHNSVWVATDHVHCLMPGHGGSKEDASYCFYVNEVFQGRAPGRIVEERFSQTEESSADSETTAECLVRQELLWRGPIEWGSSEGRIVAREVRQTRIIPRKDAYHIDYESSLMADEWDLEVGPTRHAYFGVRVAESMRVLAGGRVFDSGGNEGAKAISWKNSEWIDYSGPLGGGHRGGIAIFPGGAAEGAAWFVTDWGTIAANPLLGQSRRIPRGERVVFRMGLVVHDHEWTGAQVSEAYNSYKRRTAGPGAY
jgi:hypothetical protein